MSGAQSHGRELILRCLDGVATEAEAAELERLLASDPAVAREMARAARLESQLEVVLRNDGGEAAAPPPADTFGDGRRWAPWVATAGIAAATAAVAAALLLPWPAMEARRAAETAGAAGATTARAAAAPEAAAFPAATRDPARRIRFADGSTADLGDDDSRLETRLSSAAGVDLVLARGSARFQVTHQADRRFRIVVGSTHVHVIGTVFSVERLPDGVRVSVEQGMVKVVSGGHEMHLSAGRAEVIPAVTPISLAGDGASHASDVASDSPSEAPAPAPEPRRPAARRETRAASAAADEPRVLLRESAEARRGGHPEEALAPLQRLVDRHPRDPRAPYAAFMLGRVLLDELARPREAAAAFARVGALDPETPLVQDALAREVESWARAGDMARARERGRAYLARYPKGPRADEIRRYSQME